MSQLLRDEHGNVRKALAAYTPERVISLAGYGYADKILQQSGSLPRLRASRARALSPVSAVGLATCSVMHWTRLTLSSGYKRRRVA